MRIHWVFFVLHYSEINIFQVWTANDVTVFIKQTINRENNLYIDR